MSLRLNFRPDLTEALLEDRVLLAYSPNIPGMILTTGGYVVISTPPGLSAALNTAGGAGSPGGGGGPGGNGGNMPTSFNISGFGPTTISIGNNIGFSVLSGTGRAGNQSVSMSIPVGSGSNDSSGGGTPVSRNVVASGGFLTSGTGFLYIGQEGGGTTPVGPGASRSSQPSSSRGGYSGSGAAAGGTTTPPAYTPPPTPVNVPGPAVPGGVQPPTLTPLNDAGGGVPASRP